LPCSPATSSARSRPRFLPEAPAAADPELPGLDCAELPPAAEPCWLLEDEPLGGHWQFRLGELAPLADWPLVAEPLALDCEPWPADELVLPPAEGEVPPAALLDDGDVALLVDGDVPPAAPLVLPEALPEPEDWLVCAPWFIDEEGLVVVALWFADTLLEVFWSPVPMFTPGLMFAPALTSVLLMPTFASTPTFGFTFTPPEGAVVLPDELLGCEDCEDCVLCELWSVDDDCAYAEPNTPITAAAVTLTATWRTLMITPFINADTAPRRKRCAMPVGKLPT